MKNVIQHSSSRTRAIVAVLAGLAIAAGCGGSTDSNPFGNGSQNGNTADGGGGGSTGGGNTGGGNTGGGDDGGGGNTATDAAIGGGNGGGTGDTSGTGIGCKKSPARYVVLGHSVAHCFAVGGVDSETCALKNIHTYLATKFPGITYENDAVDGALIADVLKSQLPNVKGGPGHLFVNIYIGGNDLAAHLYESDTQVAKSWATIKPKATSDFAAILAYFDDTTKFPDGATILVNTQYNPFDECVAGQYAFVTPLKQGYIKEFNGILSTLVGQRTNAAIVDQYTTFLGHGHNFDQSQCPKYIAGAADWMADLIHPNEAGHANLSTQMHSVIDLVYKCN